MTDNIPQKLRAKVLWDAGHRTPGSLKRRGGIPESSAKRYIAAFKAGESHERKPYTPRKKEKKDSRLVQKIIKRAERRDKIYTSREIGTFAGVSHMQVCRILREDGLTYSNNRKKVKLTQDVKDTRIEFAEMMQDRERDWDKMFITDECSFWLSKCHAGKVWTRCSLDEDSGGVHGPKVHCWGGISARGALTLEIFEENLDSDDYLKIIKKKMPQMRQLYPRGYIWQQDGSGVHRAIIIKDFIQDKMPATIAWPPYSPDLSPIENIWGWLKAKVSKDMPKTVLKMKKSIRKHWNSIDQDFLRPYFQSLPRRMEMVIENEGGKINY